MCKVSKKVKEYKADYRAHLILWGQIRADRNAYSIGIGSYYYYRGISASVYNGRVAIWDRMIHYNGRRNTTIVYPIRVQYLGSVVVTEWRNKLADLMQCGVTLPMVVRYIDWALNSGNDISWDTMKQTQSSWQNEPEVAEMESECVK